MNTTNEKAKVAIIGLGKIGRTIAANLVKGNHPVILVSRDLEKAKDVAAGFGGLATAAEVTNAIHEADVIIPAIDFDKIGEFLMQHASLLKGKVIVDVSNPIAPDGNGGFKKIIAKDASAGETLLNLTPSGAGFVKAFGTLGAGTLASAAFATPPNVLFYASDSINSNPLIEQLIIDSGFSPLHIGSITQSIRIEVFGDLHEFGALGKTLSTEEAKKILSQN